MPYELRKEGDQWCVYNKQTNTKNGCSDTRAMAVGMMRRLYQVESGKKQFDSYDMWEHQVQPDVFNYEPLGGTDTKACANCQWFDSPDGCMLIASDVSPTGLCSQWLAQVTNEPMPMQVEVTNWPNDAGSKQMECMCETCTLELGFKAVWTTKFINDLPDSSFAYIEPGGKKDDSGKTEPRSLRHFPIKDENGKYDHAHVVNAEQRANSSPFGSKAMPKIQAGLRALGIGKKSIGKIEQVKEWINNIFDQSAPAPVGLRPIYYSKELNRATLVFSNNFEDRHGQTIPEVVHNETIDWLDTHKLYPTFQIWHMGEKSRWGQADVVTRIGNFTLASGPVDPGKEALAEAFANDPNTGVSNGYYAAYTPDYKDFVSWYPFEVSALPMVASANIWMGDEYALIGEGFLMKEEHKALLKAKGVPEAFLDELERDILSRGAAVSAQGVSSKENEPTPSPATDTAAQLSTVLDTKLTPLMDRIAALEEGHKELKKSKDESVADAIQAQIATLPQGFKATESNENHPEGHIDEPLEQGFDWLGKELDKIMATAGVTTSGS